MKYPLFFLILDTFRCQVEGLHLFGIKAENRGVFTPKDLVPGVGAILVQLFFVL